MAMLGGYCFLFGLLIVSLFVGQGLAQSTLEVSPVSTTVSEGSTVYVVLKFKNPAVTPYACSVGYRLDPVSAVAGVNYEYNGSVTINFAAGDANKIVSIVTYQDGIYRGTPLKFRFSITSASMVWLDTGTLVEFTINEADPKPILTATAPASVNEGELYNVTLDLSGKVVADVQVGVTLVPGTAVLNKNYQSILEGNTFLYPALTMGQINITVPTLLDSYVVVGSGRTLSVSLSASSIISILVGPPAQLSIANIEEATVTVSLNTTLVNEGEPAEIIFNYSLPVSVSTTFDLTFSGTGRGNAPYISVDTYPITLPANASPLERKIDLPTEQDNVYYAGAELTLVITNSNPTVGLKIVTASNTLLIKDIDEEPVITTPTYQTVNEGSTLTVILTPSRKSGVPMTLPVITSDGSAMVGTNYISLISEQVTIAPLASAVGFSLVTKSDSVARGGACLNMTISFTATVGVAPENVTVCVRDTEVSTLDVQPIAVADEGTALLVNFKLDKPSVAPASFLCTPFPDSAERTTFNDTAFWVEFTPFTTEMQVAIQTYGDDIYRLGQSLRFYLSLSSASGLVIPGALATIYTLIADTDDVPTIRFESHPAPEGDNVVVDAVISGKSFYPATFNYTVIDGNATAGVNYKNTTGKITFDDYEPAKIFAIETMDDKDAMGGKSLTFGLIGYSGIITDGTDSAPLLVEPTTLVIIDSSAYPFVTAVATQNVVNEGQTLSVVFTLAASQSSACALQYVISGVNATSSSVDFASGTINFAPRELEQELKIPTKSDDVFMNGQVVEFKVTYSTPVGLQLASTSTTMYIKDIDSVPTMASSVSPSQAKEGETITINFALSRLSTVASSFGLIVSSLNATDDYYEETTTINFAPNQKIQSFAIPTILDGVYLAGAVVALQVDYKSAELLTLGSTSDTLYIQDNDPLPILTATPTAATVDEGDSYTILLSLDKPSSFASVQVSFVAGTARSGVNYNGTSFVVEFVPFSTSTQFTLETYVDEIYNAGQTLSFDISFSSLNLAPPANTPLYITDIDDIPIVSFSAIPTNEGDPIVVTAMLSRASHIQASFAFMTSAGNATEGVNYQALSGTLQFNSLEVSKTISITTIDDHDNIGGKSLTFSLVTSTPDGLVLPSATTLELYIIDIDGAPHVSASIATTQVNEGQNFTITFTLSSPQSLSYLFHYTVNIVTASAGNFDVSSGTITFDPSVTEQQLVVPTKVDGVFMDGQVGQIVVNYTAPAGLVLNQFSASLFIKDIDPLPVLTATYPASVDEGDLLTIQLALDRPSSVGATVIGKSIAWTAQPSVNYNEFASSVINFLPFSQTVEVKIQTIQDDIYNAGNPLVFNFSFTSAQKLVPAEDITLLVDDIDEIPEVALVANPVNEGDTLLVSASLSRALYVVSSFDYVTLENTAIAGVNYIESSGTVTFNPLETTQLLEIDTIDDSNTLEGTQLQFNLSITNPVRLIVSTDLLALQVIGVDTETVMTATIDPIVNEGQNCVITFTLSSMLSVACSFTYSTTPRNATANNFVAASGVITFAAHTKVQTISIATLSDNFYMGGQLLEFIIEYSEPNVLVFNHTSTRVFIRDADPVPTVSVSSEESVTEGEIVTLRFTTSHQSTLSSSFKYSTSSESAVAWVDYVPVVVGVAVFPPLATGLNITITTLSSASTIANVTFVVGYSAPTRLSLANATRITIINSNVAAGTTASSTGSATSAAISTSTTSFDGIDDDPQSHKKSNTGKIVGGVIGGVVGAALVVGAVSYFVLKRGKNMVPVSSFDNMNPSAADDHL